MACHADCPSLTSVAVLDEAWRAVANAYHDRDDVFSLTGEGDFRCDEQLVPGWHRFSWPAGEIMPMVPPGPERCGSQLSGWLQTPTSLPVAGAPPVAGRVCFDRAHLRCTRCRTLDRHSRGSAAPPQAVRRLCLHACGLDR